MSDSDLSHVELGCEICGTTTRIRAGDGVVGSSARSFFAQHARCLSDAARYDGTVPSPRWQGDATATRPREPRLLPSREGSGRRGRDGQPVRLTRPGGWAAPARPPAAR